MLPATTRRVSEHTNPQVNERIQREMEDRVMSLAGAGPEAINQRLRELDEEWDIERALEANAATATIAGVVLGATVHKCFFALPAVVGGFLLMHALQGWCPPLPILRAKGFRTATEIEDERTALRELRGRQGEEGDPEGRERQVRGGLAALKSRFAPLAGA